VIPPLIPHWPQEKKMATGHGAFSAPSLGIPSHCALDGI
jgi:hypothetical protein